MAWRPRLQIRDCGRVRQRAQNLVEFGLAVAVVSILGMAGMNVLGRAELGYFVPLSNKLAPQAPVGTNDVVHPTQVTIACSPLTVTVGNSTTCVLTVKDAWNVKRSWPQGSIGLMVNTADSHVACALVQDTSTGDPAQSKCSLTWSPALANVPSATLVGHYAPSDGGHGPSDSPNQNITVKTLPTVTFTATSGHTTGCWDANAVFASAEQVENGHPIICHITVSDSSGPVAGTPIQVSGTLTDMGTPYFSCFTNNNRAAYTSCNAAGSPFLGNTDATGQLTFVYRRYYASLSASVTETFTASATAYPGASGSHSVTIAPPNVVATQTAGHWTDMAVHCTTNVPSGAQTSWLARSGLTLESDVHLTGTSATAVTCRIVVIDTDPQNAYTTGNIDNQDAYSPYGTVLWFDELTNPVLNASGGNAQCSLTPGNTLGLPYVPLQLNGLPDYASTCSVTMSLSGHHTLTAQYNGEPIPYPHGHRPVLSKAIDSDFP